MRQLWWFVLCEIISILVVFIVTYYLASIHFRRNRRKNSLSDEDNMNSLIRGLAHEIRNPLNTMDSNLQLLEEDLEFVRDQGHGQQVAENPPSPTLSPRMRGDEGVAKVEKLEVSKILDKLKRVRSEIEHLERILSNFLRYAKPKLQFEKCDLRILIEEELNFIEPETQLQRIELVRELEPLPQVWGDTYQLKQALLNLIINANQAMEGGGTLTIKARFANEQVQIDVKDTGNGIPPEIQKKVFDLFYSTKQEGTGLGLAIVKRVVEGHGGQITVSSEVGKGTVFSIFLPLKPPTL